MALEQLLGREAVKKIAGRDFGISPNSRYSEKEFLESAGDLFNVDAYLRKIAHNGNDITALTGLAGIATKYMPGDKEENVKILKDPLVAVKQAKVLLNSGYKSMADYASRNLSSLLNEMPEKILVEVAAILPDKNKPYTQIAQYMQAGDMKSARKAYAETFRDKAWKKFILECPDERIIQSRMKMYVDYKKSEFIDAHLSTQVKGSRENAYKPDLSKAKKYISQTIARYGEKEKISSYMGIATAVYHSKKGIGENEVNEEELEDVA